MTGISINITFVTDSKLERCFHFHLSNGPNKTIKIFFLKSFFSTSIIAFCFIAILHLHSQNAYSNSLEELPTTPISKRNDMLLKIKYGKNSIAILTEPNETVRDLKAKINLATDAPQQSQKLIFRGRSISFLLWRINFCFPARCLYLIQSIERR